MTTETIVALVMLAGFFLALAGWVLTVWPETDPTDDMAHERRRS